jgi:hypothetical protein
MHWAPLTNAEQAPDAACVRHWAVDAALEHIAQLWFSQSLRHPKSLLHPASTNGDKHAISPFASAKS